MIRLLCAAMTFPMAAMADVPRVMTDIAPVHSLTAQVMGDLGTPDLLLPPGADPHDFALRPSDAAALGAAELMIWVGHGLTPWLEDPLETLAPQAARLELLETPGWDKLEVRDHKGHDDHDHGHDHGDIDPHAWVDPVIAQVWLMAIADQLSIADPDNAATYIQNAAAAADELDKLQSQLAADFAPLTDRSYILPHDGYQYFEARFGLTANGALAGIDARDPGPAQVAILRDLIVADDIACVFSDAEVGTRWSALVIEGTEAQTAEIDAVGLGLEAGPSLYGEMMKRLSASFQACLG